MANARPTIDEIMKRNESAATGKLESEMTQQEKIAMELGAIRLKEKETEAERTAAKLGFPYVNLFRFAIGPETIAMIPKEQAEANFIVCFLNTGSEIRLATLYPQDPNIEEIRYEIAERTHANVAVYFVSEHSFAAAFHLYDTLPSVHKVERGVNISETEMSRFTDIRTFDKLQDALKNANMTDVVAIIISGALNSRSSDIHVEAEEKRIVFRFRVDGILTTAATLPSSAWPRVISRIKLLAKLKLNLASEPQDGRFTIFLAKEKIDVRVSTIPTEYGESVVMRILRSGAVQIKLDSLGFRAPYDAILYKQIDRPNGMIITTGPTGSGKTTTLYAILQKLNTPDTKIITLEDPIEYELAGIAQSQIDSSKEYTFAKGLRSILRQDPDVIMVGEIRDLETAETAIQAALTGHMLLSTIHTNDAAGAIPRFMSMGVKPFLLAPALNAIIGQRLCRTIHDKCKEEIKLEPEVLERAKKLLADISPASGVKVDLAKIKFFHGKGCDECNNLGYRGRIGIYEILAMSADIEKVILSGAVSEYQMRDIAKAAGMITMAQDGVLKALDGLTTVDEVFRVAE
jgi:type IV pilus assembly protein PilB